MRAADEACVDQEPARADGADVHQHEVGRREPAGQPCVRLVLGHLDVVIEQRAHPDREDADEEVPCEADEHPGPHAAPRDASGSNSTRSNGTTSGVCARARPSSARRRESAASRWSSRRAARHTLDVRLRFARDRVAPRARAGPRLLPPLWAEDGGADRGSQGRLRVPAFHRLLAWGGPEGIRVCDHVNLFPHLEDLADWLENSPEERGVSLPLREAVAFR